MSYVTRLKRGEPPLWARSPETLINYLGYAFYYDGKKFVTFLKTKEPQSAPSVVYLIEFPDIDQSTETTNEAIVDEKGNVIYESLDDAKRYATHPLPETKTINDIIRIEEIWRDHIVDMFDDFNFAANHLAYQLNAKRERKRK